jgi:hemolysin III
LSIFSLETSRVAPSKREKQTADGECLTRMVGEEVAEALPPKPRLRGVSHFYGFFVSLVAGLALVVTAPRGQSTACAAVYAFGISAMLGASALLHRGNWTVEQARKLTKLDHTAIYLMIAGTYTPISLIALSGWTRAAVFGLVWLSAAVGIVLEWAWYKPSEGWITTVYITLGWVALIAFPQLWTSLGVVGFLLIFAGGVSYTVGAVIHEARWPDPLPAVFGYHEIFHVFVLIAVVLHFIAIAFLVLPEG